MVIGLDVSHPPPSNFSAPLNCGAVLTTNKELTIYTADIALQMGGRHVKNITDLHQLIANLIFRRYQIMGGIASNDPQHVRKLHEIWPEFVFIYWWVGREVHSVHTDILFAEMELVSHNMQTFQSTSLHRLLCSPR